MRRLVELYTSAYADGALFFNRFNLPKDLKSMTLEMDKNYGIFVDERKIGSSTEELEIIAHECGHFYTGATHRVGSPFDLIERHEVRADRWAIERLVPKENFDIAIRSGAVEPWELAELFNVSQPFVEKAIDYYHMLDLMEKEKDQPTAASVDWPEEM